jgi:hypothetical protein
VDASLGQKSVVEGLRTAGLNIVAHDDIFAQGTADEVWLTRAGAEGWVVLTRDTRIRHRPNELAAFLNAGVRGFVLTAKALTGTEEAAAFVRASSRMSKMVRKEQAPFLAAVTRAGEVSKLDLRGKKVEAPKGTEQK